jgi:hypothetical protein
VIASADVSDGCFHKMAGVLSAKRLEILSAVIETTIDGTVVHLTAIQTSQLPDAVARQYGIDRAPTDILLLVNLREVGNGQAPVITATVTDLLGHTNPVQLREVQVAQTGYSTID